MLFNFEEQQINPAESTNNFSPLCVLVFYNKKTEFISRLMQDNESGRLRSDYPGFSFLIMKRRRDYSNPSFSDIAEHTLAARLIPAKDEMVSTFLVTQKNEDKVLNEGGKACSVSLDIFMIKLQEKNAERASTYGSELDDISAFVQQNLPQFAETSEQVIARMTQLFQSESDRAISNAQTVTLKLVVNNDYKEEDKTVNGKWIPVLEIDDKQYKVKSTRSRSNQVMFFYLLLHHHQSFQYSDFNNLENKDIDDGDQVAQNRMSEIRTITRTLYPELFTHGEELAKRNFKEYFYDHFNNASRNKLIGNIRDTRLEGDDSIMTVAPFTWIVNNTEETGVSGTWTFSPPPKVVIDTADFVEDMEF